MNYNPPTGFVVTYLRSTGEVVAFVKRNITKLIQRLNAMFHMRQHTL